MFDSLVIAHRGASAFSPENTLSAFDLAAQMGAKWVECDVLLTACDTPLIIHDDTLDRTTTGQGEVAQCNYDYLQTLDAGSWFSQQFSQERLPTLEQFQQLLIEKGLSANVELKETPHPEKLVRSVLSILAPFIKQHPEKIIFSSFDIPTLKILRSINAEVKIGLLMETWLPDWQEIARELNAFSIHTDHLIVTPESARIVKEAGYHLFCYTVNHSDRAKELFSMGVDAVFSDYPNLLNV